MSPEQRKIEALRTAEVVDRVRHPWGGALYFGRPQYWGVGPHPDVYGTERNTQKYNTLTDLKHKTLNRREERKIIAANEERQTLANVLQGLQLRKKLRENPGGWGPRIDEYLEPPQTVYEGVGTAALPPPPPLPREVN
jgi:hypothetical protein